MTPKLRFRTILPLVQVGLAALFGGVGLWQRSVILGRPGFGEGQTLWDTTARFHVWPWPFKFAVVTNLPAFLAWSLVGWPIGERWPTISEATMAAPSLLFVAALWYWIGSRLDRRWSLTDTVPWVALSAFILVSVVGAFLQVGYGYVDYLLWGFLIWVVSVLAISRYTRTCAGIPAPILNRPAPH